MDTLLTLTRTVEQETTHAMTAYITSTEATVPEVLVALAYGGQSTTNDRPQRLAATVKVLIQQIG
jgi:hypothetical protein